MGPMWGVWSRQPLRMGGVGVAPQSPPWNMFSTFPSKPGLVGTCDLASDKSLENVVKTKCPTLVGGDVDEIFHFWWVNFLILCSQKHQIHAATGWYRGKKSAIYIGGVSGFSQQGPMESQNFMEPGTRQLQKKEKNWFPAFAEKHRKPPTIIPPNAGFSDFRGSKFCSYRCSHGWMTLMPVKQVQNKSPLVAAMIATTPTSCSFCRLTTFLSRNLQKATYLRQNVRFCQSQKEAENMNNDNILNKIKPEENRGGRKTTEVSHCSKQEPYWTRTNKWTG